MSETTARAASPWSGEAALAGSRRAAENDGAAYADRVSEYAALGRDELR
ncbi:hypothetical protein ACFWOJ_02000 [Streptomyces sp. NPDC058439]